VAKQRHGELVIIGGRENREGDQPILEEVVALAGGKSGRIAIVPIASDVPEEMAKMTVREGEPLALDSIRVSIIPQGYGYDLEQKCLLTPEELGIKKTEKR
jgi:cyanophycinase-like exopeptidase